MTEQLISYSRTTSPSRRGALMELESSPERIASQIFSCDAQPHAVASGQNHHLPQPDRLARRRDRHQNPLVLLGIFSGISYQRHRRGKVVSQVLPEDHLGVEEEDGALKAAAVDVDGVLMEAEGAGLTGHTLLPRILTKVCKNTKTSKTFPSVSKGKNLVFYNLYQMFLV